MSNPHLTPAAQTVSEVHGLCSSHEMTADLKKKEKEKGEQNLFNLFLL